MIFALSMMVGLGLSFVIGYWALLIPAVVVTVEIIIEATRT